MESISEEVFKIFEESVQGIDSLCLNNEQDISRKFGVLLLFSEKLEKYFDKGTEAKNGIADTEAKRLAELVSIWYESTIPEERKQRERERFGNESNWYKILKFEKALRRNWFLKYYYPRTEPASLEDFGEWVEGYLEKYQGKALQIFKLTDKPYIDIYRPFEEPMYQGKIFSDLRVAKQDLSLISGIGPNAIRVLVPLGLKAEMANPQVKSQDDIYNEKNLGDSAYLNYQCPS